LNAKLIAAGLAASLLVATPAAMAASLTGAVSGTTSTSVTAAGTSANASTSLNAGAGVATPSLSSHSTFAQVTSNVTGSAAGGANLDLASISSTKNHVYIVRLSKLKGYKASTVASLSGNANVHALDANVAANAFLTAKLKAAGFTPDQVIAASATGKSGITLVVNDKA
jgi:hypothetical protein